MQGKDNIRARLDDARLLWQNGRKNGTFVMALIALAGVSRLRYPKSTSPRVYFDKLREYHPSRHAEIAKEEQSYTRREMLGGLAFKCMVLDLIEDIFLPDRSPGTHAPRTDIRFPFGEDRKAMSVEDIFYKALRCTAVHEGTFSSVAYLTEPSAEGDVLRLTHPAGIPENWALNTIDALHKTPEIT